MQHCGQSASYGSCPRHGAALLVHVDCCLQIFARWWPNTWAWMLKTLKLRPWQSLARRRARAHRGHNMRGTPECLLRTDTFDTPDTPSPAARGCAGGAWCAAPRGHVTNPEYTPLNTPPLQPPHQQARKGAQGACGARHPVVRPCVVLVVVHAAALLMPLAQRQRPVRDVLVHLALRLHADRKLACKHSQCTVASQDPARGPPQVSVKEVTCHKECRGNKVSTGGA